MGRCTATNSSGERCGRWASPFMTVCTNHGGGTPQAKKMAFEYMLKARDMAVAVLIDAMHAEPCETCGWTRDRALAVKAAIAVLDRTGMGPSSSLKVSRVPETRDASWDFLTATEFQEVKALVERIREITGRARDRMTRGLLPPSDAVVIVTAALDHSPEGSVHQIDNPNNANSLQETAGDGGGGR